MTFEQNTDFVTFSTPGATGLQLTREAGGPRQPRPEDPTRRKNAEHIERGQKLHRDDFRNVHRFVQVHRFVSFRLWPRSHADGAGAPGRVSTRAAPLAATRAAA